MNVLYNVIPETYYFNDLLMLAGAQIPIYETRSDGKDNLMGSLIMASSFVIPEVCKCYSTTNILQSVKKGIEHLHDFHCLCVFG